MSKRSTVKMQIENEATLVAACDALHIPYQTGKQKVNLFSQEVSGDFSLRLNNWRYPVVVNFATGEVHFDNYEGHWGNPDDLLVLKREYKAQTVEQSDAIQERLREGYQIERLLDESGDLKIRLYR